MARNGHPMSKSLVSHRSHQALSQLANADDREKWLQLRLTLAAVCRSSWIRGDAEFFGDVDHLQTDHYIGRVIPKKLEIGIAISHVNHVNLSMDNSNDSKSSRPCCWMSI